MLSRKNFEGRIKATIGLPVGSSWMLSRYTFFHDVYVISEQVLQLPCPALLATVGDGGRRLVGGGRRLVGMRAFAQPSLQHVLL